MPTKDGLAPERPLPLFLSGHPDEHEPRSSSRILIASILVIAATVSGIAIALTLGNPVKIFADATASLSDISALQRDTSQSTPPTKSTADAPALQPTVDAEVSVPSAPGPSAPGPSAGGTPARDEIAAAPEPAGQTQAENHEPQSEILFRQFQAWAAKDNTATTVERAEPVQDAPAPVADNAPAVAQPMQKARKAKSIQNARAEIRHVQKPRARVQREQNARAEVRPAQEARAQEQPVQTQAPSFLQSLGLRQ